MSRTAIVAEAVRAERAVAGGRHGSPVWALAGAEGRRLVRHPVFVVGMLMGATGMVIAAWTQAPALQRDDIYMALSLAPVAAATFLVANMAALRSRRHSTDELYDSTVTHPSRRTLAHLLSLAWAAGAGTVLILAELIYLIALKAVGTPNPLELLAGLALVMAVGALGIALARWTPSVVVGPVSLIGLGALQAWLGFKLVGGSFHQPTDRWLAPWVPLAAGASPSREIVLRPIGWHVVYLVAIAGVLAAAAMLRHRAGIRPLTVAAAGLALTLVAGFAQTRPPSPSDQQKLVALAEHPERSQLCRSLAGVRYCAYPGYVQWIDRWSDPVQAVLRNVPAAAHPSDLEVRQAFVDVWASDLPNDVGQSLTDALSSVVGGDVIRTGTDWGRRFREGNDHLALSLATAAWTVGFPRASTDITLTHEDLAKILSGTSRADRRTLRKQLKDYGPGPCDAQGQARAAIAMWLAIQVSPGAASAFRAVVANEPLVYAEVIGPNGQASASGFAGASLYGLSYIGEPDVQTATVVSWPKIEARYALELLALPRARVAATLRANWSRLTDPATPTDELAGLFGVRAVPSIERQLQDAGVPQGALDDTGFTVPCR